MDVYNFTPNCRGILWQIDQDEPVLRANLPLTTAEETDLAAINHPAQRVEWLACRVALQTLVGRQNYAGLWKDEFGKPYLINQPGHISLSHTEGWAAAVWHDYQPVGIDIEPQREQFNRVVPRVLSAAEIAHANGQTERLAVYWCAKEALYKLYGKRKLTFREHLIIEPFADGAETLRGHVRLPDHEATLTIRCFRTGPGWLAVAF
jgi:4'-phosphopantetheinyl transferase